MNFHNPVALPHLMRVVKNNPMSASWSRRIADNNPLPPPTNWCEHLSEYLLADAMIATEAWLFGR